MFEDSTFESSHRIRTRSRGWMLAAFAFNGSILLALVLIPLIYPEALPRQMIAILLEAPPPPPAPQPSPAAKPTHAFHGTREFQDLRLTAPSQIPPTIKMIDKPEAAPGGDLASLGQEQGIPGGAEVFRKPTVIPTPAAAALHAVHLSSGVVTGLLLQKTTPVYPPIAVAARVEGTVVLQATISKLGIIANLRVASGPPMLQQAALDAVKNWRYRPYLLNGEPVDVETTVNVVFSLGRQTSK
jgi:protein TonB